MYLNCSQILNSMQLPSIISFSFLAFQSGIGFTDIVHDIYLCPAAKKRRGVNVVQMEGDLSESRVCFTREWNRSYTYRY